jgi:hypothetical protein
MKGETLSAARRIGRSKEMKKENGRARRNKN